MRDAVVLFTSMASSSTTEIEYQLLPLLRVYKDGRVERLRGTDFVPAASNDPLTATGVSSKDITINYVVQDQECNVNNNTHLTVSVSRLYLPKLTTTNQNQKFPLLVYFHGGGFCISSPFTSKYHSYLNALVAEANVVAVSVNYRKAPEHPIPAANQDFWAALQWVVNHGPESWLNEHADFEKLFLSGDSAGANIAHNMAIVAGHPHPGPEPDPEFGLKLNVPILGVALVHPYFWGSDPIGCEAANPDAKASVDRLWLFLCPSNPDKDDRLFVCVAENDALKERGWLFNQELGRCGWMGVVEIQETQGEDHGFHLYALGSEKAQDLIRRLAAFFNREMPP